LVTLQDSVQACKFQDVYGVENDEKLNEMTGGQLLRLPFDHA